MNSFGDNKTYGSGTGTAGNASSTATSGTTLTSSSSLSDSSSSNTLQQQQAAVAPAAAAAQPLNFATNAFAQNAAAAAAAIPPGKIIIFPYASTFTANSFKNLNQNAMINRLRDLRFSVWFSVWGAIQ